MTITTEEAEALAGQLEERCDSGEIAHQLEAAAMIRALAAERDIANEQIYGLAEERGRWKERAERAEVERDELRALVPTNHQTSTRWTIDRDRPNEKAPDR